MESTQGWLLLFSLLLILNSCACYSKAPEFVNVGVLFSFESVIGRAAKAAMKTAVVDVNKDSKILNGTQIRLIMEDTNCSVFKSSIGAFQMLERDVVAIIGPQSSTVAHMISQIANGVQVPIISYAATDPTLSSLQFPYFFRTTQSDSYQMAAVANLIDFYGWKEVIAIYTDDEYGRNGIFSLDDEVEKRMSKISYKLALPVNYSVNDVVNVLNGSIPLGPRVYIVHVNPDPALKFFQVVNKLNMTTSDYIWLTTDWLCTTLSSFTPKNRSLLRIIEGVVGLCQHTPQVSMDKNFGSNFYGSNVYGPYAYDAVWAVAHTIDTFLNQENSLTFTTVGSQFGKLKIFDGGEQFIKILSKTNFDGLTGPIRFDGDRNLVPSGYKVFNMVNLTVRNVGYWSNHSGLSVKPPETLKVNKTSSSVSNDELGVITWPGGKTDRPRGWVIGDSERPLRIGIPKRASFVEFVTELSNHTIAGYCIDVFKEALKLVPYDLPYRFVPFGDGAHNPNYDDLVRLVMEDVFDGAVGDIAIVTNRTRIVDYTQPYATTGLVIVVPINNSKASTWVFLRPFTIEMWCVTATAFVLIALVIWLLEHRVNKDFRGPLKRQLVTIFLFSFSTLFKRNQEDTISPLARMVMVVWLFLLLVITSSYTASLTSILTVQQLSSPITGIDSLVASRLPIGYQVGSFAYTYLAESLFVPRSYLIPLGSPDEYEKALRLGPHNGGVAAIVDELPYIELFLLDHHDFAIVGQPFTRSGWGFAFKRDSPLATTLSLSIMQLSENGKLQEIHEKWFCEKGCSSGVGLENEPNQLQMSSFYGLYMICGIFSLTALVLFLLQTVRQYIYYKQKQMLDPSSPSFPTSSSSRGCYGVLSNFCDFIDEKEEAIKNMFKKDDDNPQGSQTV
ncbi:putative periplasmic binding protein-like I [Helianthus annuus]|uniref:Glutamate receptor n=2 Tax=Helianthus annuus TaxID=4232 RepID=A0A251V4A8_HELAN|nr:glutamate receptor 3.7 isoform X1 [Helianthus annuus]KAF5812300.1 putative periplasmic binding protein-like I [Helianthus annuus]KAJ0598849.1 putative periplasmic binding protein-like I [Helianthus annuus]